ncbi:adenylyltransferase and sulfurtransferase MOCS3 isoform X2 [Atheta coriaria]|uniref:adenylyltransferase and sulfurtransferase MOCS3 isoform X2 n=1 Tax=Dalotia coriaria TaxID=877792 RepID=UPI0031F39147
MGDVDIEVTKLEEEIRSLKQQLSGMELKLYQLKQGFSPEDSNKFNAGLTTKEVMKYSRQILVPSHNVEGQILLKNASVLIVGAGGLGSPCANYLVAAGVGSVTIVDNDDVENSNLHRQILHSERSIGLAKVDSAYERLRSINTAVDIIPIQKHFNSTTVNEIMAKRKYHVVIDGTDNVATRYLLNDACVLNGLPLVSGSALQMEGQLTVYHYMGGPCYRCIFPQPPPPQTVNSCGDSGVLGPIPGTIGVLQALETIKILTKQAGVLSGRLLTFDGSDCTFRNVKLRPRSDSCVVCGLKPTITTYIDYEQFCGAKADDKVENVSLLKPEDNVNVNALTSLQDKLIIDVRPELEFKMCHLPESINVPYEDLNKDERFIIELREMFKPLSKQNVFVICRRGNDSQRAVLMFNEKIKETKVKFLNIRGGLHAYAKLIDPEFPVY